MSRNNCRIIAFSNQKGGVGKTTSCINIAACIASKRRNVLVIDLDPQGNATMGSGVEKNSCELTVNDVLLESVNITDAILKNTPGGFDLVPANSNLTYAEVNLVGKKNRELKLKNAVEKIKAKYDFVFLDCPPSLNMLTLNGLVTAESVIIPMQCEYYALEGLSDLVKTINKVKAALNPSLVIEGIIQTMFDPRNNLSLQVTEQLKKFFPNKLYKTKIPRNVRLAEAPSHGVPVILYDKSSRGAIAYMTLSGEIMRRKTRVTNKVAQTKLEETV